MPPTAAAGPWLRWISGKSGRISQVSVTESYAANSRTVTFLPMVDIPPAT